MEIKQVVGSLVCTHRIPGLRHADLRVLADPKGRKVVATDPVGARVGNWVFVVSGSAARYAMGDAGYLTDLTIGGIIDLWDAAEAAAAAPQGAVTPAQAA
jgi:carboxysome peptide B